MNTTSVVDHLYNEALANLLALEFLTKVKLCVAPIACVIDLSVVHTIWRTKELHDKCHVLMLSVSMSHAIYATMSAIYAGWLLIRARFLSPLILPAWLCILGQFQLFPYSAFTAFGLNLAIDRFMCVIAPIFYRHIQTKRYILIVNLLAYTYYILVQLVGVIGTDIYQMIECESGRITYNVVGSTYQAQNGNIRVGLLAVLYASGACSLIIRYKKAKLSSSTQKSEWKSRWKIRVFMAMCADGAVAILMRLAQGVLISWATQESDTRIRSTLNLIIGLAIYIEGSAQLAIYLVIDKKFRAGFRKTILDRLRRNAVTPMADTG